MGKYNAMYMYYLCVDPEAGGGRGPEKNKKSQSYSFFSNTGQDLLKNHKTTKPAFNVAAFSGICLLLPLINLTLSLPSTSKKQYLSAKPVSRTPEY